MSKLTIEEWDEFMERRHIKKEPLSLLLQEYGVTRPAYCKQRDKRGLAVIQPHGEKKVLPPIPRCKPKAYKPMPKSQDIQPPKGYNKPLEGLPPIVYPNGDIRYEWEMDNYEKAKQRERDNYEKEQQRKKMLDKSE